ncbi:hypothetical protein THRCLA_02870 [Thraustotheca clavata]|uniref:Uncharacterized protein n=1 Tax=Thraustotheca clavata TaxID=74557 RepID=A0A1W0A3S3_9STRA|nr:hypothetical protein THRCLA_02870 [Thraustotheca clavata]
MASIASSGVPKDSSCKGCQALYTENQLLRDLLLRTSTDAQGIINAFEKQMEFERQRMENASGIKAKGVVSSTQVVKPSGQISMPLTPDIFRKLSSAAAQELVKVHPEYKELYDVAMTCKGSLFERIANSDLFTEEQKKKQLQLSIMRQHELNTIGVQMRAKSPKVSKEKTSPTHITTSKEKSSKLPISPEASGDNYFKLHNDFVASLRKT